MITLKVENAYECGRQSTSTETVEDPASADPADVETWWMDVTYEATGDGHACGKDEHAIYTVTVLAAPNYLGLVGQSYEHG